MKTTIAALVITNALTLLLLKQEREWHTEQANPIAVPSQSAIEAGADYDDIFAADTRLLEFLRGTSSHVDEQDLEIGSTDLVDRVHAKLD